MRQQSIIIIGGGFGGLAAACLLAKAGHRVTVFEKNEQLGGRVGQIKTAGFTFDTGPSWYLMTDVFERFFLKLGEPLENYITLTKLSPAYRVFDRNHTSPLDIYSDPQRDSQTFEAIEPGAGKKLRDYLAAAEQSYRFATNQVLYRQNDSLGGLFDPALLRQISVRSFATSLHSHVGSIFRDEQLQKILEYPSVFLGGNPYNTPAFYGLLSYLDFTQGVFYPQGGMYTLVEALVNIGQKYGVRYRTNHPVEQIFVANGQATGVQVGNKTHPADVVISDAGMHFTEQHLLDKVYRDHSERFWRSRTVAPSALLLYLRVNRQYTSLRHHNLVFSKNWRQHFADITKGQAFPHDPSMYICAPSKTDPTVASPGKENLVVLVPVAPELAYSQSELKAYIAKILAILEQELGLDNLRNHIVVQKHFCVKDFSERFNSFQGSALGLTHTLRQSAMFRPKNYSKKVSGLFFVGADVHPGIGLPTTLISAELVANRMTIPSGKV